MKLGKLSLVAIVPALSLAIVGGSQARGLRDVLGSGAQSTTVQAAGRIEMAFSPNEGAEELVVRVIRSEAHPGGKLRMLAYSLTNPTIVRELIEAAHAGADEKIVADYKENVEEDRSGKGRAALGALATAGIDVRTIRVFPTHHDKATITPTATQTGSYNYSVAASRKNSENVVVMWDNPQVSAIYLRHFERNYAQATPYRPGY